MRRIGSKDAPVCGYARMPLLRKKQCGALLSIKQHLFCNFVETGYVVSIFR